mmetsp:Transcript_94466/g.305646  ORF Transcript_94466/g.305646 Transcript_94466/m.305646 type:complete len:101 (+) Transcript_94466:1417-1719(+)
MALAQSEKATEDERHALQQHAAQYATPEALAVHVQACVCVATQDKPNFVRILLAAITICPLLTRDPPIGHSWEWGILKYGAPPRNSAERAVRNLLTAFRQ